MNLKLFAIAFLISTLACSASEPFSESNLLEPPSVTTSRVETANPFQFPFVKNEGQLDSRVSFYARTATGSIFVTAEGIAYRFGKSTENTSGLTEAFTLREEPVGGRFSSSPSTHGARTTVTHPLGGNRSQWQNGIRSFDTIQLGEVWPGITVSMKGSGQNIEKIFAIAPGGDVNQIRLRFYGGAELALNPQGALVVKTKQQSFTLTTPLAYQIVNGTRRDISVRYSGNENSYGFHVGEFDRSAALIIDPSPATTSSPEPSPPLAP